VALASIVIQKEWSGYREVEVEGVISHQTQSPRHLSFEVIQEASWDCAPIQIRFSGIVTK
jgi:hypothetical protein